MRARRHRLALPLLLLASLLGAGLLYAAMTPLATATAEQPVTAVADPTDAEQVAYGRELFLANCSTCHGFDAEGGSTETGSEKVSGPSLIGVGAASVDFQVGTGRMPLQATGPQAPVKQPQYDDVEVKAMAAFIASLAPGPAIPSEFLDPAAGDVGEGAEVFRTNCAMCHNFAGSGGALTQGKYAPSLRDVEPVHVYEAMLTGPQAMPVFGDNNVSPEQKQNIVAYLDYMETESAPGGLSLGLLGPVSEGLVGWIVGIGGLVACAVWLGAKAT